MTDFNDLHRLQGLEAVAECIRRQVDVGEGEDEARPGNGASPEGDSASPEWPQEMDLQSRKGMIGPMSPDRSKTGCDNG